MKKQNSIFLSFILVSLVLIYFLDVGREAAENYATTNFNITLYSLMLLIYNILFTGVLYLLINRIHKGGFSSILSWFMVFVGCILAVLPFIHITWLPKFLPYGVYKNLMGAMLMIVGLFNIFRHEKG